MQKKKKNLPIFLPGVPCLGVFSIMVSGKAGGGGFELSMLKEGIEGTVLPLLGLDWLLPMGLFGRGEHF